MEKLVARTQSLRDEAKAEAKKAKEQQSGSKFDSR